MRSLEDRLDEAAEDYTKVEKIMAALKQATEEHRAAAQRLLDAEAGAMKALAALPDRDGMVSDMLSAMEEARYYFDAGAVAIIQALAAEHLRLATDQIDARVIPSRRYSATFSDTEPAA